MSIVEDRCRCGQLVWEENKGCIWHAAKHAEDLRAKHVAELEYALKRINWRSKRDPASSHWLAARMYDEGVRVDLRRGGA